VQRKKPVARRFKCNIDASFPIYTNRVGIEICIREEFGIYTNRVGIEICIREEFGHFVHAKSF